MKPKLMLLSLPVIALAGYVAVISTADAATDGIDWKPCGETENVECGTVSVPRDWSRPDDDHIDLNMVRHVATSPDSTIGSLFFNPGGPGVPASGYVGDYAEQTFSPELLERFDIIGIDPRGVGDSQQLHCDAPVHDPQVPQYPHSKEEYQELVAHNQKVADSCDDSMPYLDSVSVAKDFDAVRAALGESTIDYLGQSYGSLLGTAYAQQFPDRIRTMVLDGVVDHSMSSDDLVIESAAAVENAFNRFALWCDTDTDCALHGRDVGDVWDALLEQATTDPIPVPDGRDLTADELSY
ncbi:MAG: alpha/beta fold hydrolase, partial [Stackebrandtia sp.]